MDYTRRWRKVVSGGLKMQVGQQVRDANGILQTIEFITPNHQYAVVRDEAGHQSECSADFLQEA